MMKQLYPLFHVLAFVILSTLNAQAAPDHPQLKAFPAAKDDQKRFVIVLPDKIRAEEGAFKVELIPGKVKMTDGVNRVFLSAKIELRPLKGWGYTFYEVTGKDRMASTRIGVPPGTPKVEKFVAGQSLMIRYNSRLPVVIYAPKGYEIRYRIWKAGEEQKAEK